MDISRKGGWSVDASISGEDESGHQSTMKISALKSAMISYRNDFSTHST
jgi:hypothetical protein